MMYSKYVHFFCKNPFDRACTNFESMYAYGAILGRQVRNFQIGRPYSFQTAGGDSGQVTHMYVNMMSYDTYYLHKPNLNPTFKGTYVRYKEGVPTNKSKSTEAEWAGELNFWYDDVIARSFPSAHGLL